MPTFLTNYSNYCHMCCRSEGAPNPDHNSDPDHNPNHDHNPDPNPNPDHNSDPDHNPNPNDIPNICRTYSKSWKCYTAARDYHVTITE